MKNEKVSLEEFILQIYRDYDALNSLKSKTIDALYQLQSTVLAKDAEIESLKAEIAKLKAEIERL